MGIKKNFIYSSILTVANYLFPFITFPYISRVLEVTNVGKCNFVDGIVSYFILLSTMGLGVIGVREIAKSKILNDQKELNSTFSNLLFLNLLFTIVSLFLLCVFVFVYSDSQYYTRLLYIGGAKVFFTLFLIEWFYKGVENFRYITIRSVVIRCIYVFLIFFFVKDQDDYIIYYSLTTGMVLINGIINIMYSRKFVSISFRYLNIKKYFRPVVKVGIYTILTSMYTTFNVVYLGIVSTDDEVGYYTTAIKLYTIILAVFTAFTGVIMPRVSALIEEGKLQQVISILEKSFKVLFTFCFPVIFITLILAPQIIFVIAGSGYENAVIPMQIIMPLILVVGLAQIFVMQILIPFKKDDYILINAIVGAVVGLLLNILLVRGFASVGSAIVILVSELVVLISAIYFSKSMIVLSIPYKNMLINALFAIPYLLICRVSQLYFDSTFMVLLVSGLFSFLYFAVSQIFIIKNEICISFFNVILYKIKQR